MKIVMLGFLLLATSVRADDVRDASPEAAGVPAELRFVWIDRRGLGRTIRTDAMAETSVLFQAAAVPVRWETGDGRARAVRDGEIQIVLLSAPPAGMPAEVLGAAYPDARGARAVWVFLRSIRTAIGADARGRDARDPANRRNVARAVGRVVAHEVVHLLVPDRPHSDTGLMASRLSRSLLVAPKLSLDDGLRGALDDALPELAAIDGEVRVAVHRQKLSPRLVGQHDVARAVLRGEAE